MVVVVMKAPAYRPFSEFVLEKAFVAAVIWFPQYLQFLVLPLSFVLFVFFPCYYLC